MAAAEGTDAGASGGTAGAGASAGAGRRKPGAGGPGAGPLMIVLMQVLFVAITLVHRPRLLHIRDPVVALEWLTVPFSLLTLFTAVAANPGYLEPPAKAPPRPPLPVAAVVCLCWMVIRISQGVAAIVLVCARRVSGIASRSGLAGKAPGSPTVATASDVAAADDLELQPLGRTTSADDDGGIGGGSQLPPVTNGLASAAGASNAGGGAGAEVASSAGAAVAASTIGRSARALANAGAGAGADGADLGDDAEAPDIVVQPRRGGAIVPGSPRPGAGGASASGGRRRAASGRPTPAEGMEYEGQGKVLADGRRFCKTCELHVPLRTKHCRECGGCVRTHDHHCPWIGNCVGEGNRFFFYWYLVAQTLELTVFWVEGALFFSEAEGFPGFWMTLYPAMFYDMCALSALLLFVSSMLGFHTALAMLNVTTWEVLSWNGITYLRNLPAEGKRSPFSLSLRANLAAYCCPGWCPLADLFFSSAAATGGGLGGGGAALVGGCGGGGCLAVGPEMRRTEDGWHDWELGAQHRPPLLEWVPMPAA